MPDTLNFISKTISVQLPSTGHVNFTSSVGIFSLSMLKYKVAINMETTAVLRLVFLFSLLIISACGADSSDLRSGGGSTDEDNGINTDTIPSCGLDLAHRGFVSSWRVDAGDEIRLPLPSGFNYNFAIDWGDGSGVEKGYPYVSSFDDSDIRHTYDEGGKYQVTIYGMVEAWSFATFAESKDKLVAVDELGDVGWKSLQGAFASCSNLTVVNGGNTEQVTDMSSMFEGTNSVRLDVASWNFKQVSNMQSMFNGVTLADADYSTLLRRIVATTKQNSVPLDGGNSHYDNSAAPARSRLVGLGWQITDGGLR